MRHIDYEVFVRMMNHWTPEDQARLAQAKARHLLPSCPFVNAVREESPSIDRAAITNAAEDAGIHPDLLTIYVDGARCGEAYVVVDELSGEIGEAR